EGNIKLGTTTPMITSTYSETNGKRKLIKEEVTEQKIVIYDKAIKETYASSDKTTMESYGKPLSIIDTSVKDLFGSVATHEGTHATDPGSQRNQNKNLTLAEVEKKPLDKQHIYLDQQRQKYANGSKKSKTN